MDSRSGKSVDILQLSSPSELNDFQHFPPCLLGKTGPEVHQNVWDLLVVFHCAWQVSHWLDFKRAPWLLCWLGSGWSRLKKRPFMVKGTVTQSLAIVHCLILAYCIPWSCEKKRRHIVILHYNLKKLAPWRVLTITRDKKVTLHLVIIWCLFLDIKTTIAFTILVVYSQLSKVRPSLYLGLI